MKIAQWVADIQVSPHMANLIYVLLDDNNDGSLSIQEFSPVLFQWRKSRGFRHQSLLIEIGNLKI